MHAKLNIFLLSPPVLNLRYKCHWIFKHFARYFPPPRKWINKITGNEMAYKWNCHRTCKKKRSTKRVCWTWWQKTFSSTLSAKQRYTIYLPHPFKISHSSGSFIQIFALILYHFAFRISIMLHEIDINKSRLAFAEFCLCESAFDEKRYQQDSEIAFRWKFEFTR